MSKRLKKRLIRIVICLVAFIAAMVADRLIIKEEGGIPYYVMFAVIYIAIGYDVIKKAFTKLIHGKPMDENFLMVIASVGAFFISECDEAVAVMLFYQIGEWFQAYAVGRSRASIKDLMDIRPDYANLITDDGEKTVDPTEVSLGDIILIKPGEKVPLDGVIIDGNTTLDTMALTGESVPREALCGDRIISGCINLTNVVKVKVEKEFGDSTVAKILDLVENATAKKAKTENFITKFARYYTPVVVILALSVLLIPTLIFGGEFLTWLYRALSFLVISCPCALVISIPLGFFGGIGGAGKAGILVKGSSYLEMLADVDTVVMDKTGTLTKGVFDVNSIVAKRADEADRMLELAALAESYSSHPISLSLKKAYESKGELDKNRLGEVSEIAGKGVVAEVDGAKVYVGNAGLMELYEFKADMPEDEGQTICHVATENGYMGYILISDEVKPDAADCIRKLKDNGVNKIVMLTGDRENAAKRVAGQTGITEYYAGLLPGDKVDRVEDIMGGHTGDGKVAFVGDGINDAPVLARADVGIAMGGLGSDAAIEAADVVIMNDEPVKIALAMKIARKTKIIVKENIVFAIGIKVLILIFAALGFASMWAAVFADVGVAFLAILNSMRTLRIAKSDR
ncbi:MAG: cadmium-translocating P-type ATPase [Lachnospiraceae bacterium]|nr:cadmium-translocating P-type ATPase [Lachnospiraceae bacterium]